jgi:tripartite-type tricarboxylate transporter receptor subunit TctC
MNLRGITAIGCLAAALVALTAQGAWPQAGKTIKIIVPYSPGNGPDILARLLGQQIAQAHGPNVVIENRPGGGAMIGADAAARSAPDGTTLLLAAPALVINDALKRPSSTPVSSFDPVCQFAATPMILVVRGDSSYKTLNDLLAAARAKPGELQMVSGGPATSLHVAIEVIKRAANVTMTYVPYGGTAPAINALMGAHVTAVMSDYPTIVSQLQSGTLRPLVTISDKRVASLPGVPTLAETGLVNYDADIFYGLVAPAKTPPAVVAQLIELFTAAAKTPEANAKFEQLGLFAAERCGADWGAYLNKQLADYARIARESNIKAD